jgi:Flp pilus assembly protein TadD
MKLAALFAIAFSLCACANARSSELERLRQIRAAEAAYRAGDLAQARDLYERLLRREPAYAQAHVKLGAIAYREGDRTSAQTHFRNALRFDSKNPQATYNLAMLSLDDAARYLDHYLEHARQGQHRDRALQLRAYLEDFAHAPQ